MPRKSPYSIVLSKNERIELERISGQYTLLRKPISYAMWPARRRSSRLLRPPQGRRFEFIYQVTDSFGICPADAGLGSGTSGLPELRSV